MSQYLQFSCEVSADDFLLFEEKISDLVPSFSWDPSGIVIGHILEVDIPEFNQRITPLVATFSPMDDTDWLELDQELLPPLTIGNFRLLSPHHSETPSDKLIPLTIDSGHAFGSGHHETTATCLEILQELAEEKIVTKALDIGCGSGVLAIAIAKLWDIPVFGCDTEEEAVRLTIENAIRNDVDTLTIVCGEGLSPKQIRENAPYDLIVANIHSDPLIALAEGVAKSLTEKGCVILSGLLSEQAEAVVAAYNEQGLIVVQGVEENGWMTLLMSFQGNRIIGHPLPAKNFNLF